MEAKFILFLQVAE